MPHNDDILRTYYALAESRNDAESFASDPIDDAGVHGFTESANQCTEVDHVYDFEDGELVYHDGNTDIEVKEAFGIATGKNYATEMRARLATKFGSSHGG